MSRAVPMIPPVPVEVVSTSTPIESTDQDGIVYIAQVHYRHDGEIREAHYTFRASGATLCIQTQGAAIEIPTLSMLGSLLASIYGHAQEVPHALPH